MRKLCHIRLVIFDLDGTLIDSAEDIAIHVGRVYREFKGKDVPADEVKKNIGDGGCFKKSLIGAPLQPIKELTASKFCVSMGLHF